MAVVVVIIGGAVVVICVVRKKRPCITKERGWSPFSSDPSPPISTVS